MFKIGEFAAITQVPISQLRYYDEIDLFKPNYTSSETGYRYYSAEQIPQLDRIIVLKELGFSLAQIRGMVYERITPEQIWLLLNDRRDQIIQTLKDEMKRLRQLEGRLEQLAHQGNLPAYRVIIKEVPEQRYLSLRGNGSAQHKVMSDVYAVRNEIKHKKYDHLLAVLHNNRAQENYEVGYIVQDTFEDEFRLPSGDTMQTSILPSVDMMASLVYAGEWDNSHNAYAELGRWMEQNQYQMAGSFRKIFLQMSDPSVSTRAVIEVQIPITLDPGA